MDLGRGKAREGRSVEQKEEKSGEFIAYAKVLVMLC